MTWNPNATVSIGGVDFTGETLGGLAIHYGRPTIWDQARASYATVSILNSTDTDYAFEINDDVVVEIQDSDGTDVTVFTGKVTDISNELAAAGSGATVAVQTLTAVGPFAQMARTIVGTTNYPKEYDDDRINRILTEAGVTIDVVDTPGVYELQERPSDPQDAYTLSTYYAGMCFGYMYETKAGAVGYANESRRTVDVSVSGYLDIAEGYINWRGINSRKSISDIVNKIILFYKNGQSKTAEDTASATNYGLIEARIDTELEQGDQAQNIADRYVSLRSVPETNFSSFNINLDNPNITAADLDQLINIEMGTAIQISDLPNAISPINYRGFVEGWDLVINQYQANLTITSSDSTYSVVPIRWQDVDPTTIWTDIDPTATTSTKTNLVTNPTFEPINYGALGYVPMVNSINNLTNIYVPDQASFDITGDIDIRVLVSLDDWTPATQHQLIARDEGLVDRTWILYILTTGRPQFVWWDSGGTIRSATASIAPTVTDGAQLFIRVTLDVDNGAAGNSARFYSSTDGLNWTQIGTTQTQAFVTSIRATAAQITVGIGQTGYGLQGKFYKAEVRNGIDGTPVFYTDIAGDWKATDGFSYTTYTGQTASIMSRRARTQDLGGVQVYDWQPNTGTALSNTTAQSYSGRGSLLMTVISAGTTRGLFIPSGRRIPVTAGQTYTLTAYVRDGNTGLQWRNVLQWYSLVTGGSLTGQTTGTSTTISSTGWTRITVTGTAPAGTTAVGPFINMPSSATLNTYAYIDAIQFESGSGASSYFDGYASDIPAKEYPALAWTGTAQQSTSTAVAYWGTKPTTLWQNVDTVGLP
jgi:hypothetical protein